MGLGRAIVIGPEPMIQRHHGFPVVALEVAVMQMMEITAGTGDPEVSLEDQLLEPEMPLRRGKRVVLGVHQHVDGMRGHDPVNQNTAEDNQVLNRMHGQTGPGPDVDVFVMEVVYPFEEGGPVQETMEPVEVEDPNHGHADKQHDKVDRIFSWIDVGQQLVGVGPHHQHFISRPDRNSADTTPEDVVAQLVPPEELTISRLQPLGVVFVLTPLRLTRPEPVVPGTIDDDQQHEVADKHLQDPVELEGDTAGQGRLEVEPRARGDAKIDHIPRIQVTWETKQVFESLDRLGWPGKQRTGWACPSVRVPESPFIPRHAIDQSLFFHADICH